MIDHYDWPGGREAMIRFGPASGPVVIVAAPLFEEANRTRAFVTTMLRIVAIHGIGAVLPDLPGTGESLIETENASLTDWQSAFSALAARLRTDGHPVHGVALRGGALVDGTAALASHWHFAPVVGESLVRDMLRARVAAMKESGEPIATLLIDPPGPPVELAGNRLSRSLLAELAGARPSEAKPRRIVRLETDSQPADRHVSGTPLWRRSEPGNDVALARLLADDIAEWVTTCGG